MTAPTFGTQPARMLEWIRENPGTTSLEITQRIGVVNVTGRASDLRDMGYDVRAVRDGRLWRYYVVDAEPVQVALFFADEGVPLHRHGASSVPRNTHPSLGNASLTKAGAR